MHSRDTTILIVLLWFIWLCAFPTCFRAFYQSTMHVFLSKVSHAPVISIIIWQVKYPLLFIHSSTNQELSKKHLCDQSILIDRRSIGFWSSKRCFISCLPNAANSHYCMKNTNDFCYKKETIMWNKLTLHAIRKDK